MLGDLVAAITAPGALDQTVAAPFGDVSGETFARFVVLDGLVHGWDLATATGQPYEPPDELVAAVDVFAHQALDPLRDGRPSPTRPSPPRTRHPSNAWPPTRAARPDPTGSLSAPDRAQKERAMTSTLTLDALAAVKEKQQATWASGDYAVSAPPCRSSASGCASRSTWRRGRRARRRRRQRQRVARRRSPGLRGHRHRLRRAPARPGPSTGGRRRGPAHHPCGRRRGPPVRRRQLRRRRCRPSA